MVAALIKHAHDKESKVAASIKEALIDVGRHQPNLVCSSIHEFLRNPNIERPHRIVLLLTLNQVVEIRRDQINPHLAQGLIALCMHEMLHSQEVIPDWQLAASNNLVSLGQRFGDDVLDALFSRFPPGAVPHYFVIKTLGQLFATHPLVTVHRLKVVLARVLPILSSINKEAMQWVFATAIGQFCAAAMDFVANKGQDVVALDSIASDMFPAYEILFNRWAKSRERRVVLASMQAIGYIMAMLPLAQYEQQIPKLIPVVLQLWRVKEPIGDSLPITLGMFQIILKANKDNAYALQPLLPQMMQLMTTMVCTPFEETDGAATKNHNELLRCIEYLARQYVDSVIGFLLQRLDPSKKENTVHLRVGTLEIFKHLITRMASSLNERKSLFVAGIKPLLKTEKSNSVKKYMNQVIISMAQHDYLGLEGGQEIIEWVVLNSSISDAEIADWERKRAEKAQKKKEEAGSEKVSPAEVRQACDDLLALATSTIPTMEPVLWPFLLELIVAKQNAGAIGILARCIGHLALKQRTEGQPTFFVDWDRAVNLPKPQALIARMLVAVCRPHGRTNPGVNLLRCLAAMGPMLHPNVEQMWDSALPRLVDYVQDSSKFVVETWEDLVLRLLSETIRLVNDPNWTRTLGQFYTEQLDVYENDPELKRLCMKHLGLVLQKTEEKRFIRESLATLFDKTQASNSAEREGCAQAYGYCSTTHLDITVDMLTARINEQPPEPEKKGLFGGLFSSAPQVDQSRRNLVFLCFGYVAAYAPVELIPSRAEVTILTPLKPIWRQAKTLETKLCVVKTIDLIGKALHPSRLTSPYVLPSRDELVDLVLDYIAPVVKKSKKEVVIDREAEKSVTHELRAAGLVAIATLALLPPRVSPDVQNSILQRTRHFLDLKVVTGKDGKDKEDKEAKEKGLEDQRKALKEIFAKFGVTYAALMFMNTTEEALSNLMRSVEDYTSSADPDHRERSTRLILYLLSKFFEYKGTREGRELPPEPAKRLSSLGHWVGLMVPRLCDPVLGVRKAAVECIEQLLFVNHVLHLSHDNPGIDVSKIEHPDDLLPIFDIRDKIDTSVLNEQFQLVHDVAQVLCRTIPKDDLPDLILSSLPGLSDPELNASAGVCVYLNAITSQRGAEVGEAIPDLVNGIGAALQKIQHAKTLNGTLHALKNLASHHLSAVVDELLKTPKLPHPEHVVKSFQAIAKDGQLVVQMLAHVCDVMNNSVLYKDTPKARLSEHRAMSATAALADILGEPAVADVLRAKYAPIVGTLLMRFGTSVNQKYFPVAGAHEGKDNKGSNEPQSSPASDLCVLALRSVISLGGEERIEQQLDSNNAWSMLSHTEDYPQGIQFVARGIFMQRPEHMAGLYAFLVTFMQGNYDGQRLVSAAVLAEMVAHCGNNAQLVEAVINTLLGSLLDPVVKIMCIRGFGNIVSAGVEMVNRYSQTILDALLSAVDSQEEAVALEAMNGLAKVFDLVDENRVAPVLVNLCNRVRPAMESTNGKMRAAAFNLFGTLWHFGQKGARDTFFNQIHANFPLLILHCNDEEDEVKQACKKALRQLGPLMRFDPINELFQSPNLDPQRALRYNYFLDELCKLIVRAYPERINYMVMQGVNAFKSTWSWQRANAVLLVGFLLGNLPVEDRKKSNLNPGMVAASLIQLLQDKSGAVRKATAETMALLHSY